MQVNADTVNDAQKLKQFQAAQGELGSALSRLMVVSENYPQLKADGLFQNLQAQLEGTENRVTVARNRYVQAVQEYNSMIRTFPNNLTAKMFGYKVKPNFSVENEKAISTAPKVDFGNAARRHPPPRRIDDASARAAPLAGTRCWRWPAAGTGAGSRRVPTLARHVTDLTGTLTPHAGRPARCASWSRWKSARARSWSC